MDRESFELSFQRRHVYEVGAALLVLLTCPEAKSEARLGDLYASLCAKALWLQHLSDHESTRNFIKQQLVAFCETYLGVSDRQENDKVAFLKSYWHFQPLEAVRPRKPGRQSQKNLNIAVDDGPPHVEAEATIVGLLRLSKHRS